MVVTVIIFFIFFCWIISASTIIIVVVDLQLSVFWDVVVIVAITILLVKGVGKILLTTICQV